jgi:hypothetical protein
MSTDSRKPYELGYISTNEFIGTIENGSGPLTNGDCFSIRQANSKKNTPKHKKRYWLHAVPCNSNKTPDWDLQLGEVEEFLSSGGKDTYTLKGLTIGGNLYNGLVVVEDDKRDPNTHVPKEYKLCVAHANRDHPGHGTVK